MDILNYTLFTISGDVPVLLIDLITSLLGLTCVFLAGRNSKYNFWVGYLYTLALGLMFWNKHLYASPVSYTHLTLPMDASQEGGRERKGPFCIESQYVVLGDEGFGSGIRLYPCLDVGLAVEDFVPRRSCSLSGCLRYSLDSCSAVPFFTEKMGLLGCLACRQHHSDHIAHIGRTRLYAYRMLALPGKRSLVSCFLV